MSAAEVNIPLLRKAVEWAEAEAAKPPDVCAWLQGFYILDSDSASDQRLRQRHGKSNDCGTCYCIAGWTAEQQPDWDRTQDPNEVAAEALGIDPWPGIGEGEHLFHASNTIEDVRRIAESLAGERL